MKKYILMTIIATASITSSMNAMFGKFATSIVATGASGNRLGAPFVSNSKFNAKDYQSGMKFSYSENALNQERSAGIAKKTKSRSAKKVASAKSTSSKKPSTVIVASDAAIIVPVVAPVTVDPELTTLLQDVVDQNFELDETSENDTANVQSTTTESSTTEETIVNKSLRKDIIKKALSLTTAVGIIIFVGFQFSKQYKKHSVA